MSNLMKFSLLILLIFILIPVSFAADLENVTVDNEIATSDDISESLNIEDNIETEILSDDDESWVQLDSDQYSVDEDDWISIEGYIHIDIIDGAYYYELNVDCSYEDFDGNIRTYTTLYDGSEFTFNTANFEGLKVRDSPYILNFTVVKDELFDEFVDWFYIDAIADASVTLTVNAVNDSGPCIPLYDTFTPKGQIYVAESGSDSNSGSEDSPYLTIQKALDVNKALGGGYEVILNQGWYIFSKAYTISNNVRITGKGKVEILNGGTSDGYLFFTSGANIIEFNNLTMSGGTAGAISGSTTYGGDGNAGKVLNIINCTFEDNSGSVGVITTYSKTTILQSTFINNNANGYTSYFRGLISARDNTLTVNFCNFIGNTLSSGNPLIYSEVKTNANYNFWQSNDGFNSDDIIAPKIKADNWVVIVPQLRNGIVIIGNSYNFDVKFMGTNSTGINYDLNASMPNLDISLTAKLGQIPSNGIIENNISTLSYNSGVKGLENITVSVNNKIINYLTFNVDVPDVDKIYVSPDGDDLNVGNISNPLKTINAALKRNDVIGGNKVIIITSGVYNEYDLVISNPVTIIGENGAIINAENKGRILIVSSNADIYNVTFRNAFSQFGSAVYHNSCNLNINNCIFYLNDADYGGVVLSNSSGNLGVYNSKFISNKISGDKGSAIYSTSATTVINSVFINNIGEVAQGCIYLTNDSNIVNNNFVNNKALIGGAIYINGSNQANIIIKQNYFALNNASNGGAVYIELASISSVENNKFINNSADYGGAVYLYGSSSQNVLTGNNFTSNANDAIYINSSNVDLENNIISENTSQINIYSGIIGNIIVEFNGNQTLKLKNGQIQLNATVTDDMGNIINGGSVSFTINGEPIGEANVVNGKATLIKELDTGNYEISGKYSASTEIYPPLETKTSLVRINVINYWFINQIGYETLQEAIDAAEINDVIMAVPGVYDEPIIQIGHRTRPAEPWVINKNITITSLGDEPVTLNAIDRYIFYIDYYSNVTFRNIIFTGANNPNGWGGGIDSMGKNTIVVENCTFRDNIAENGAAMYIYGNLFVKDCLFINNTATVYGGAIVKDGDGDFSIENCKFINNSAFTYSGAVDCRGYSEVIQTFKNVTFESNSATCAGALYTSGKNVTFVDCVFNNNKAVDKDSGYSPLGGAVYTHNAYTTFINTNFTNNYAEGTGGALQLENSVTSILDSSGRHITIHWGIFNNCLIENNTALDDGGAFYTGNNFRTHVNITNSIIRNNSASNGALLVNLYGFYTLDNVTVENNKNTAGSSLIYSYGVYSYPESFYANTNIKNSKFKNNDAERFISTTTVYSSVNITDSVFEDMGMLIYSYEGSICNLTNVREINPREGNLYSIDNTGTLSLKNNSFVNPIINKATINTPTFLEICANQTIIHEIGDTIQLEARVVDDNGNIIIGHDFIFNVLNTNISSTFEDNKFVANYEVVKGIQIINGIYDDKGLIALTVKYAVIDGKSELVVNSSDITVYLKADNYNFTVCDLKGNPISDINLLVNIAGREYNVDSDVNGVVLIDLDLSVGSYSVNILFDGDDRYNSVNVSSKINILSTIKAYNLKRGYNSPYDFVATFLDINGNPLNNTKVILKVNNKNYGVTTDENGVVKLTKLSVGTKNIVSINPSTSQIQINKVVIVKRITNNKNLVMDYKDGSKFKVRLIGDDGKVVGKGQIVKFTLNGKNYKIKTNKNGYAFLKINLAPKTYKITVNYKGYKVSNKIKIKSVIKAKNISKKKSKKIKYTATLKTSKGKLLKGKKVIFKIKGKTYKAKTNRKGVAKVYLKNLKVGKHKITIKYLSSAIKKIVRIRK